LQELIRNAAEIIREAARSALGLAALIILALAIIGVIFFKKEKLQFKALMFVLMFIGFIIFGYAMTRVGNSPPVEPQSPTDTASSPLHKEPAPRSEQLPSPTTSATLNTSAPTPSRPEPPRVSNDFPSWAKLIFGMQWHIMAIQRQEKFTRFFIEIRNIDEKSDRSFYSFNKAPLVVIDDGGSSYRMLTSSDPPEDVSEVGPGWHLQAGRTITVAVDFAPLLNGKPAGHIVYRDNNSAEPAKFSFAQ